jgi:hypothetical protein
LRQVRFKTLHKLLGLVSYLDWIMIIVTTLATISQLFETPHYRVMNNPELQVAWGFISSKSYFVLIGRLRFEK